MKTIKPFNLDDEKHKKKKHKKKSDKHKKKHSKQKLTLKQNKSLFDAVKVKMHTNIDINNDLIDHMVDAAKEIITTIKK